METKKRKTLHLNYSTVGARPATLGVDPFGKDVTYVKPDSGIKPQGGAIKPSVHMNAAIQHQTVKKVKR